MRFQYGRFVGRTQGKRFLHLIRIVGDHIRTIRSIRSISSSCSVICNFGGICIICRYHSIAVGSYCSIAIVYIVGNFRAVSCGNFDICIVIVVYHRKIDGFNGISGRCVSCNIVSRNIIDGLV